MRLLIDASAANAAFTASVPQTDVSGLTGWIECGEYQRGIFIFAGVGAENGTLTYQVTGRFDMPTGVEDQTRSFIPIPLAAGMGTLGATAVGSSGTIFANSGAAKLVDTLTETLSSKRAKVVSPADDTIAYLEVDLSGLNGVQIETKLGASCTFVSVAFQPDDVPFFKADVGVPVADSAANVYMSQVIGNKTDAASETASTASLVALVRQLLSDVADVLDEAREVEEHVHSGEHWFGTRTGGAVGETQIAERIGAGATTAEAAPLVVDAGNDDWGTWTQILGSSDTPTDSGSKVAFDLHRMRVSTSEVNSQRYLYQIALQEDAPTDDPGATDVYTEGDLISQGAAPQAVAGPIVIQAPRVAAGTKVWMRTWAPNQNTATLSIYIGIHEYTY